MEGSLLSYLDLPRLLPSWTSVLLVLAAAALPPFSSPRKGMYVMCCVCSLFYIVHVAAFRLGRLGYREGGAVCA